MQCSKCRNEAIFFQAYSGRHLCSRHLVLDIEARAKRSIRSHQWMRSGDHIAVVISGDSGSAALLCFLKKLVGNRKDIRLSAVLQESAGTVAACRSMERIPVSLGIPLCGLPTTGGDGADPGGITGIATSVSLEDMGRGLLGQFLFGNVGQLFNPAPDAYRRFRVICPFVTVPSGELDLYWKIEGTGIDLAPATPGQDPAVQETDTLLGDFSRRHPATKYALLHLAGRMRSLVPVTSPAANPDARPCIPPPFR